MRENRQSGSEGGGAKPIASPYPYNSFGRYAAKKYEGSVGLYQSCVVRFSL
jgi:hypothetical protein